LNRADLIATKKTLDLLLLPSDAAKKKARLRGLSMIGELRRD
jgi:hypothetical protein